MIDWKLIGDIFLCLSVVGGGLLFAIVNARYQPRDKNDIHK
tara:strand:- start:1 stop:123 length:123 start_codon:yes stop_codon:yes gene_type:complete